MMVINPDSVTAITEINRGNGSQTTGSGNAGFSEERRQDRPITKTSN